MTSKQTASRSAAEWRVLVEEWERSGKPREAFALSRGLVVGTLSWWIGKIRRLDQASARAPEARTASAFLPVKIEPSPQHAHAIAAAIERVVEIVLPGGERVHVPVGIDATWAGELVAALRVGSRC
jgi:hypothetical protein